MLFKQDGKIVELDPATIKSMVYWKDGIPEELNARVKVLAPRVMKFYEITFEQFEFGFQCDAHPEGEIAIWEHIADTIDCILAGDWLKKHIASKALQENIAVEVVETAFRKHFFPFVLGIANGQYTPEQMTDQNNKELSLCAHAWYVGTKEGGTTDEHG